MYAVIDSVTKLVAMGADRKAVRLTFQEYFEKLGDNPKRWGKPFAALLGALRVQKELQIPAIGGKDSMSGTFMDIDVPPTLVSFGICAMDAGEVVSTEFKKAGSQLVYLPVKRDAKGIIDFDAYRASMDKVRELTAAKKVLAACALGEGGLFMALVKMAVGNKIGACAPEATNTGLEYGAMVLEIPEGEDVAALFAGVEYQAIGYTTDAEKVVMKGYEKDLNEIIAEREAPLEGVFPVKTADNAADAEIAVEKIEYKERNTKAPAITIAKPRVIIPAFPGTNCEMDSRRAFERAGAQADIHIIRNRTQDELIESIKELEAKIKESNIVMLPGGFSGGDEPDGSAKFITAIFRNERIKDAVTDLLENRDGLMLGICNGFQALIKLGLVPEGRIIDTDENSPTLTFNKIGRHQSQLIRTRVASVKSPWFAGVDVDDVHTIAISHGEGRFIANDDVMKRLIENGQIATQYVDFAGNPTMDIAHNPNFSNLAVEGITSPDGRVLGKMGHSERIGSGLYRNVDGNYDIGMFRAAVKFFKG